MYDSYSFRGKHGPRLHVPQCITTVAFKVSRGACWCLTEEQVCRLCCLKKENFYRETSTPNKEQRVKPEPPEKQHEVTENDRKI